MSKKFRSWAQDRITGRRSLLESLEHRVHFHGGIDDGHPLVELPTLIITKQATSPSENGAIRAFTITRDGDLSVPLAVNFLVGGRAKNGLDYGKIGTTATIPAGEASVRIKVRPVDDSLIEGSETVTMTLQPGETYQLTDSTSSTMRIIDNDAAASVSVVAQSGSATEAGVPRTFTFTRAGGDLTKDLLVGFTVGGTATNGVDYGAIGSSIVIPAGQAAATLRVRPIDDQKFENTESVTITINSSTAYMTSFSQSAATIGILDNDANFVSISSDASVPESGAAKTITVSRTGPTIDALLVNLSFSGSATNGTDYQSTPGTLTIPAGATSAAFSFTPIDDSSVEGNETAIVTVSAGDGYFLASPTSATLTITDNDFPVSNNISWSSRASSPIARAEALRVTIDNRLYVFGGFSNDLGPVLRSDVYNPATDAWTQIADLPKRLTHAGIVADGHDVYVAGGYVGIGSTGYGQTFGTREVWKFNIDTQQWTSMPQLPRALASGGCAIIGRVLHYFGGNDSNRADAGDHYAIDLDNLAAGWQTLASMPDPRSHFGTVVFNNRIYVIGGQHGNDEGLTTVKTVNSWDPASPGAWNTLANLPLAVSHIGSAAFVLGNRIVIAGGETAHNVATNRVTAYSVAGNNWVDMTNLPASRFSGVATVINNDIYFTTGSSQTTTWKGVLV